MALKTALEGSIALHTRQTHMHTCSNTIEATTSTETQAQELTKKFYELFYGEMLSNVHPVDLIRLPASAGQLLLTGNAPANGSLSKVPWLPNLVPWLPNLVPLFTYVHTTADYWP